MRHQYLSSTRPVMFVRSMSSLLLVLIISTFSLQPVLAQSVSTQSIPVGKQEIVDSWAAIMYCQDLYSRPQVSSRVYPGDLISCDAAYSVLQESTEKHHSSNDQLLIENAARRKARAIRSSARDNQSAVMACRQQCRSFSSQAEEPESGHN
jgi:hypothetical protein